MATAKQIANSCKILPGKPPIKKIGMKAAISEMLIEMTVKPICFDPIRAASKADVPDSISRTITSITTMASSTTNPTAMMSAINDKLSILS